MAEAMKGPASYFPSIEAKYGRSIAEWKAAMRATGLTTHGDLVSWLKAEHGFGHGHAGAITHHLLSEGAGRPSDEALVDALFTAKKAHWRPVYDALATEILGFGDVRRLPKKTMGGFATKAQFVMLQPSTPDRFDVGLKLKGVGAGGRLAAAGSWNTMMTHRVSITEPGPIDDEVRTWVRQAYEGSL